jgi:hypothetical protein
MFGDWGWNQARTDAQESALKKWLSAASSPVAIELGAGTDVPSVRAFCESLHAPLIRINPRAPQLGGRRGVGIAEGALTALSGICAALAGDGFFGAVAQ